jgi:parallel beta-helix repeat protein
VALLFLGLFAFVFTDQPARAQSSGTIIINPDGSISSPVPANITTSDMVTYNFNGSNYLPIVVNKSNTIINGMGHMLQAGSGNVAFYLGYPVHNVTMKNTTITNSGWGVEINSYNNTLSDNTITGNVNWGIEVVYHNDNTLSDNNVTANGNGIYVTYCNDNALSGNIVKSNTNYGIDLQVSLNDTLSSNNVNANNYGIALISSSNDTLSGNNVTASSGYGIYLTSSSGNVLSGNNVTANTYDGIDLLTSSDNNTLSGNTVTANSEYGVYLDSSSGNVLSGNNVTANPNGIHLYSSFDNTLSGNNIANSIYGILAYYSDNNTLSGNNFTANSARGVALYSSSDNNTLSGNNIANSACGIELSSSSGNTFYHNNFVDNGQQVYTGGSPNTWDNGYPSGGNYWSDYVGVDLYHGSGQNNAGGDGIGDANYSIDANNVDRYPLMAPFKTFSVGTWNKTAYSVDIVSNSTISAVSFNPYATPEPTLSFDVTGANNTTGFCRVTIPDTLMWVNTPGEWMIMVNGTLLKTQPYINDTGGYTYIYFNYAHSTETVTIQSTGAAPEFQPSMLLPLFMIITLLGAVILKRKRSNGHTFQL